MFNQICLKKNQAPTKPNTLKFRSHKYVDSVKAETVLE